VFSVSDPSSYLHKLKYLQELIEWFAAELLAVEERAISDRSKMDIAMSTAHHQYFT
jgi:hypothetical protein